MPSTLATHVACLHIAPSLVVSCLIFLLRSEAASGFFVFFPLSASLRLRDPRSNAPLRIHLKMASKLQRWLFVQMPPAAHSCTEPGGDPVQTVIGDFLGWKNGCRCDSTVWQYMFTEGLLTLLPHGEFFFFSNEWKMFRKDHFNGRVKSILIWFSDFSPTCSH